MCVTGSVLEHRTVLPWRSWLTLGGIDFFIYSRAAASAADIEVDPVLNEEHWSYMDQFADGMTARGPTFAASGATWTGSLHIVDLPDLDAARRFVEREPYDRAGLFDDHVIRRFKNLLGRNMWEFPRESVHGGFLVIAHHRPEAGELQPAAPSREFAAVPSERLIIHGELLLPGEEAPAGIACALHAPGRESVGALLAGDLAGLDERFDVEIHRWEFGGRR
jgi:uncharacterized protein YciI